MEVKCRSCLTKESCMFPMDEDFVYNYNILTSLDVKTSDDMPQLVCESCLQSVKFFIGFRERCIVTEASLRSIVEDVKMDIKQDLEKNIKVEFEVGDDSYLDSTDLPDDIEELIKKEHVDDIKLIEKVQKQYKKTKCKKTKRDVQRAQNGCEEKLSCGVCPKQFSDKNQLVSHLEEHKTCTHCWICPQAFRSWAHVISHRILHVPQGQKTCHVCSKRFITTVGLEYHFRKIHLAETTIKLSCSLCTHTFDTPRKLSKHINSLHSTSAYICDYCRKVYHNKSALKAHIRSHMDIKSYVCDMCDFSCKYSGGLTMHKIRHHAETRVTCRSCGRVFGDAERCARHRCGARRPAVCPVCGLQLSRGGRLSRHMETHSAGGGRHQCPRCPKAYRARGALAVHLNQHDGNRNLRCDLCPATFYHPSALGKHRRVHTGEKPYVCKTCGRGFTGNNNLKVHMRVHGEYNLIVKRVKPEIVEA